MKITTLIAGAVMVCIASSAQNLVVNPGFETFRKGPGVSGDAFATYGVNGWSQPTAGSADWYCTLEGDANPIPVSTRSVYFAGPIKPCDGTSFAGLHITSEVKPGKNQCEYMTGSLTAPLKPGHVYTISFWIALGSKSTLSSSQVQVQFIKNKTYTSTLEKLGDTATLSLNVTTSPNWTKVEGDFVAEGGEEFFTLGALTDSAPSVIATVYGRTVTFFPYAYYYVDGFSVTDKNPSGPITISPGQKLTFNNILFDTGKSTILASSFKTLDQIVAAMKKQPDLKVTISGHTDSDGDAAANQTLSEQRAIAVKKYFVSKGIDSTRITTKGFGSSQPIGSDKSKNRRVEFVFGL